MGKKLNRKAAANVGIRFVSLASLEEVSFFGAGAVCCSLGAHFARAHHQRESFLKFFARFYILATKLYLPASRCTAWMFGMTIGESE
jgi:hypothetical protein